MRFLKGFLYAFQGIAYCISHERNMRIHTVALLYVSAFSLFFQLSRVEYAFLFLTFALVMMAEMVNTAIERLCDKTAKEYHPLIKHAKDMAAGAVLVCAVFAVGVAVCLFGDAAVYPVIWSWFLSRPWAFVLFLVFSLLSVVYIVAGPLRIRDFLKGKKKRRQQQ